MLNEIVEYKKGEVELAKGQVPIDRIVSRIESLDIENRSLVESMARKDRVSIIGEIKKASPSKGLLRKDLDASKIAGEYETAGVDALSVISERRFFRGNPSYIEKARLHTSLPVLRKDFIIDEYQIYESRALKADAILLISRILGKQQLYDYVKRAREIGLEVLVETHDEEDLEKALFSGAKLIGINNRNLKNFETDIGHTVKMIEKIPRDRIVVSESGIRSFSDMKMLENAGVGGVLVGETFMKSQDIFKSVKMLRGE